MRFLSFYHTLEARRIRYFMNAIFLFLFLICGAAVLFTDPELFLSTTLGGASAAASLSVALLASYAVWLGLMQVWEECGLTKKLAKLLSPILSKLFKTKNEATVSAISMNLAANMLGIGSAATPYGIEAVRLLDSSPEPEYATALFFALNATSIQLIPTSVVGLRSALGSGSPADIVLPTLIVTTLSTLVACALVRIFIPPRGRRRV